MVKKIESKNLWYDYKLNIILSIVILILIVTSVFLISTNIKLKKENKLYYDYINTIISEGTNSTFILTDVVHCSDDISYNQVCYIEKSETVNTNLDFISIDFNNRLLIIKLGGNKNV